MKLKTVSFCLYGVILLILFNKINCIANQDVDKNLITEEERRGAAPMFDQLKTKSEKRGIYIGPSKLPPYPSGYGQTNPGYATYERPHYPPQLPPSGPNFPTYEIDHTPIGFGYGHGNNYGHSGPSGEEYGHKDHGYTDYGHKDYGHKALALKSVLLPLAGIALLGAAAALTTNPILLQLGVVNGRRRRRRSLNNNEQVYPENPYVRPEIN